MKQQYKNLLVEYKGGGYNGCFWEWNYFAWDDNGHFNNIRSTGYKGVKDEREALAMILDKDLDRKRFEPELVDLSNEAAVIDFVDNGNASLMKLVADSGVPLKGHCQHCENLFDVKDMIAGSYSGDGGITISAKDLYCEDCYHLSQESKAILQFENVVLEIGDCVGYENGRSQYHYSMAVEGELIFKGYDYGPSPLHDAHSFDSLVALLGFLTIKPGDTDDEYFKNYTRAQMDFANSGLCEELAMIANDHENGEFDDHWQVDEGEDKYWNTVHVVTYGGE